MQRDAQCEIAIEANAPGIAQRFGGKGRFCSEPLSPKTFGLAPKIEIVILGLGRQLVGLGSGTLAGQSVNARLAHMLIGAVSRTAPNV